MKPFGRTPPKRLGNPGLWLAIAIVAAFALWPALASNIDCFGFSPLSRQTFTGLFVSVLGNVEPGDRVSEGQALLRWR